MANFDHIESVKGESGQVVMGRLTKDVDLFEGMIEVCKEHGIQTATFQCIGSLKQVGMVQINQNAEGDIGYTDTIHIEKPVEILSGTGFIGLDVNGELDVHFHGLIVDPDGNITGGHFLKGENPTAVTMEYVLKPASGIHLQREIDDHWKLPVFKFSQGRS
ncbi:PPC domain-containing DNA-binding protein [Tenuibacillus multivorans]|uniref:PPC domain-containing protein n=1 Tax=Tenuibacillus multivorans TaxID=237069 RepID=A0A1H0BZL8_9BACI|nr:PPC domain-containing DNA-binding protein [Tenuibacillus multivorans]GEL78582.1 hypothetical protein TMU01_28170 [Tenuibacillus multivorans]SDN51012.1 hypothetical protein SAMN05216498_2448 [Tenuibacillus multivorans]